jgi:DNA-binding CsgD family transcriptional regulator
VGALGLYRAETVPRFTAGEADVVAAAGEAVAVGIRRTLFTPDTPDTSGLAGSLDGPAVLVVGPDNRVRFSSAAGLLRVDQLGGPEHGCLPTSLLATLTAARVGADATTRIRSRDGEWLVARGAVLNSSGDSTPDVVVTIEVAGPREMTVLTLTALGLTDREHQVAQLVLHGVATTGIASTLHLSPHTVQDHLKPIFGKAGVRSRRDLIAQTTLATTRP